MSGNTRVGFELREPIQLPRSRHSDGFLEKYTCGWEGELIHIDCCNRSLELKLEKCAEQRAKNLERHKYGQQMAWI